MYRIFIPLFALGFALASCNKKSSAISTDGPITDSVSYALGYNVGKNIRSGMDESGMGGFIDRQAFLQAFAAALDSLPCQLTEEQLMAQMMELEIKQKAERNKAFESNQSEGAAFLAENAQKPGVQTTPSGLQYQIVKEGKGPKPTASDKVKVSYRGTLIDGTEFDNSANHGGAVEFMAGEVIPGWTEALQMMPVGSKWNLWIPHQLAYGDKSPGDQIPPYSTLIFEVELLGIVK
jgi:FKBP-type peptidyl-prolyl cis-trans isomerase